MFFKIFSKLFFYLALAVVQVSFLSGLPFPFRELNLVLVFLVFSLEFGLDRRAVWWFILVGFIFDIYSSFPFGFFMVFWPLVFLFCRFLSVSFFTNRSLYSFLGLSFFVTSFYYFFKSFSFYVWKMFGENDPALFLLSYDFWLIFLAGLVANILAVIAVFYFVHLATDRLKPVFLFKSK